MASLGTLGTPRDAIEPDVFEWFGSTVRTSPEITDLALVDFMDLAGGIDYDDPRQATSAIGVVKGFLRELIHPDDFDEFWRLAKSNRQGVEDVLAVGQRIVAAFTDRPTMRPTDSSVGPSSTRTSLRSDVGSIVAAAHPGRPDLQVGALRVLGSQAD